MTDTELNRKVAEKLGIEWHEFKETTPLGSRCSCGMICGNLDEHIRLSTVDFTLNAKYLIEVLMKRAILV